LLPPSSVSSFRRLSVLGFLLPTPVVLFVLSTVVPPVPLPRFQLHLIDVLFPSRPLLFPHLEVSSLVLSLVAISARGFHGFSRGHLVAWLRPGIGRSCLLDRASGVTD